MVTFKRVVFAAALVSFSAACSHRAMDNEPASADATPFALEGISADMNPAEESTTGAIMDSPTTESEVADAAATTDPALASYDAAPTPEPESSATSGDEYMPSATMGGPAVLADEQPVRQRTSTKEKEQVKRTKRTKITGDQAKRGHKRSKGVAIHKKTVRKSGKSGLAAAQRAKRKKAAEQAVAAARIEHTPTPPPSQGLPAMEPLTTPVPAPPAVDEGAPVTQDIAVASTTQVESGWMIWGLLFAAFAVLVLAVKHIRARNARRLAFR